MNEVCGKSCDGARSHLQNSVCCSLVVREWFNVVSRQKLNKQTNKQIKQTNKTVSMSSSMVVWLVRSHVVSKIAPILPLKLLSVCMVSSLPYCMQRANTEACIHETCNVRTQMHADRNNAKCEHRAYIHDTWNVRAQMHADRKRAMCEHRDAMSVSEPIDSSRLLMPASDVRANAHRRRLK